MTDTTPARATRSLAATVVWRLLAVLAIALVAGFGAFAWLYQQTRAAAQDQGLKSTVRHFELHLAELDRGWLLAAKNLRSQVAHTRILDDPARWQQRLTGYLVTLADGLVFTHVLLTDANGRVVFSYQPGGQPPPLLPRQRSGETGWLFAASEPAVYRMIALPMLVQGRSGHALVMLVALDNVLLSASTYPGVEALLLWQDRVIASSRGNAVVGQWVTTLTAAPVNSSHAELVWNNESGAPRLLLQLESPGPVSPAAALLPFLLAGVLLALGGWLVLGGWLARLAARIDKLKQAGRRFSGTDHASVQAAAAGIETDLPDAAGHDDLSDLAAILAMAMRARLAAEQALRFKDEAIAASLNAMAFGDLSGRLMYVNRAFLQMWGYTHDTEVIGRVASEFTLDPAQTANALAVLREQGSWAGELAVRRRDGSVFTVLGTATVIRDAGGVPAQVVASFFDISDRRRAEDEARQLNATLEQRVRERTATLEAVVSEIEAFSYSVSHDLRAPLRAVDGFARMLEEDYAGRLDETAIGYLARIRIGTQRMGHLIDDLLELSRVGRAALKPVALDLSALAREVVAELRAAAPARVMDVVITPDLRVRADAQLLRVVLFNLFDNAWKYTSMTAQARIEFRQDEINGERVFSVRDNGAGFDMQYANKLFQPFQRLHTPKEFEGSGIGLATVARIVRRHGGRVWAEATPGKGALFCFTLPAGAPSL